MSYDPLRAGDYRADALVVRDAAEREHAARGGKLPLTLAKRFANHYAGLMERSGRYGIAAGEGAGGDMHNGI